MTDEEFWRRHDERERRFQRKLNRDALEYFVVVAALCTLGFAALNMASKVISMAHEIAQRQTEQPATQEVTE